MSDKNQYLLTRRNMLKTIVAGFTVAISHSVLALPNKQEKQNMSVNVIVSFEAKKEKIDEFNKIMSSVKTDLPKVNGCISVNIFNSSTNEYKFTLVETWESKELHQTHIDKLLKDGTWDMIASHLSKDPKSDYFIKV